MACVVNIFLSLMHVFGCNFELNIVYIEDIIDKCFEQELSLLGGFRVEKLRKEVGEHLGKVLAHRPSKSGFLNFGLWGVVQARVPQPGIRSPMPVREPGTLVFTFLCHHFVLVLSTVPMFSSLF